MREVEGKGRERESRTERGNEGGSSSFALGRKKKRRRILSPCRVPSSIQVLDVISDTPEHRNSTPEVVFKWRGMTSY